MSLEDFQRFIPVAAMGTTWCSMKEVRDCFDLIFREFGSDQKLWETEYVRGKLAIVVRLAFQVYRCAFMGQEQTEMRFSSELSARSETVFDWVSPTES
jgi:hypothetical protein